MPTTCNKPSSRQGSFVTELVIAPVRGEACSIMSLSEFFEYDAIGLVVRWKERPRHHFKTTNAWKSWNTRLSGNVAFELVGSDLEKRFSVRIRSFGVGNRTISRHRVVWYLVHGPVPDKMDIDHINRLPGDNRVENLRIATRRQNVANSKMRSDNSCGMKGVHFNGKTGKWVAQISIGGKRTGLGYYHSKDDAYAAYLHAARKEFGDFFSEGK